jgi:hypothetical protein
MAIRREQMDICITYFKTGDMFPCRSSTSLNQKIKKILCRRHDKIEIPNDLYTEFYTTNITSMMKRYEELLFQAMISNRKKTRFYKFHYFNLYGRYSVIYNSLVEVIFQVLRPPL